jgi:DNA-binding GntR family transcriptional regulator
MPRAERHQPMWQQVADFYKREILEGRLRQGDRLPSIREIRDEWGVSQGIAQQAVAHLHLAEHLVRTDASGTYVDAPRAALGPQQRARLAEPAASEQVGVLSAGLVTAPAYVVPILGLHPNGKDPVVVRREQVTRRADGTPHMLSVTWTAPWWTTAVPELTQEAPLPDPKGAAHLIAARTGRQVEWGRTGFEARAAKDDGRELVHLGLAPGAFVLAGVYTWLTGDDTLEYTEYVLPPAQVIEFDMEP